MPTPQQVDLLAKLALKHAELGLEAEYEPPVEEGPILTAFRFRPKGKTRVTHLEALAKDYAMISQTESVVVKRMPGDSFVTIFIPNQTQSKPKFLDLAGAAWKSYHQDPNPPKLPLMMGMDWKGVASIHDLSEQPHVLVAGATGSGKSNFTRGLICSIVYILNSSVTKLVLSDTKGGIEFPVFDRVPHLLYPRATTPYQTVEQWDMLCKESDERLAKFAGAGVTNIHEFNDRVGGSSSSKLPFIIVIIDELADVLELGKLATGKLDQIVRRSRAAGIYCIAGTQRPSVKVVEGQIKANFPARLCFKTGSMTDSRVILDQNGAEGLLEKGDMLFKPGNGAKLHRLHAPLAKPDDIKAVIDLILMTNEQLGVK